MDSAIKKEFDRWWACGEGRSDVVVKRTDSAGPTSLDCG